MNPTEHRKEAPVRIGPNIAFLSKKPMKPSYACQRKLLSRTVCPKESVQ